MAADEQLSPEEERARLHRLRMQLEFPLLTGYDFDDPKHEWRRLFSELLGTFFLVLVGAGGAVVNAQSGGAITRTAAVAAPGLMVMAIILFMGAVSVESDQRRVDEPGPLVQRTRQASVEPMSWRMM
jgi:hypothetical protein